MSAPGGHRLEGLEPDNLLAFLALLGLLRALEAADRDTDKPERLLPRAAWDLSRSPLRPILAVGGSATVEQIATAAARGTDMLAADHDFSGRRDLDYTVEESREFLAREAAQASAASRSRADLLAALVTDGAVKDEKTGVVQQTPLCLLFGQGHQHFLERLGDVPRMSAPAPRGRGKHKTVITDAECLGEALFRPWRRVDATPSFRWDPHEDVRYALMAGDPTDPAYKTGTQHGANRLATIGLAVLTVVPARRRGRVRAAVVGGEFSDGFSFAWPVWRDPASLVAIRGMLAHPGLRKPSGLKHLGVQHVYVARRISVGKFMNMSRGMPLGT